MHISVDIQNIYQFSRSSTAYSRLFSNIYILPNNQQYLTAIFFTEWYCRIWQSVGQQFVISPSFTKSNSNI